MQLQKHMSKSQRSAQADKELNASGSELYSQLVGLLSHVIDTQVDQRKLSDKSERQETY